MRIGTHAAIAVSDGSDGLADTLPGSMFGIPYGSIGMISRIKGGLPWLP